VRFFDKRRSTKRGWIEKSRLPRTPWRKLASYSVKRKERIGASGKIGGASRMVREGRR
jgi:hypothetical protein